MGLRLLAVAGLLFVGLQGYAQDSEPIKKSFRPDIPGSIMLEFGFNFKNGSTPADFKKGFWGSRTLNI